MEIHMASNKPDVLLVGPAQPVSINGLKSVFTVHRPIEASTKSPMTGAGTGWRA
jgi:hypothetical protein